MERTDGPELVVDDPLPRRLQRALLLRHLAGKLRHEPSRAPQSRCLRLRVRSLLDCYGGRRGERGVGINSGERGGAEGNGIGRREEPYGSWLTLADGHGSPRGRPPSRPPTRGCPGGASQAATSRRGARARGPSQHRRGRKRGQCNLWGAARPRCRRRLWMPPAAAIKQSERASTLHTYVRNRGHH